MVNAYWSRLEGFFKLSIKDRRAVLGTLPLALSDADFLAMDQGLIWEQADRLSENVIATFALPFSIAANFIVDDHPVIVPMVTEEPSIVAASSKMAKLVSTQGGFKTKVERSLIKGQIQIFHLKDSDQAVATFLEHKDALMAWANEQCPRMRERGGGVVDMGFRLLASDTIGPMFLLEPVFDVVDAMGANFVNSMLESLAERVRPLFNGIVGLRILSNLCDKRLAYAECRLSFLDLAPDEEAGHLIAEKMLAAHALAEADIYRACTHNKGILNGIDAVAIATGNDFRAIEAGAHSFAASQGAYRPLTTLSLDTSHKMLIASLALPLSVGVVGGIMPLHNGVKLAHKLLGPFAKNSKSLSSIMVSVGLAQCLAALLALCQEGIQKGHMKLHEKKLRRSGEPLA